MSRSLSTEVEDEEKKRLVIKAGIGLFLIIVSVCFLLVYFHHPSNNDSAPDGTLWKCVNGHQFTLTTQQLNDYYLAHYGQPMVCPTCGATAERAIKCPHCGEIVTPEGSRLCPNCKQPLYTTK